MLGLRSYFSSDDYLSVDFSPSSIKLAKASSGSSSMTIEFADQETIKELSESNRIEKYTESLRELVNRNSISRGQNAILSLPTNSVIVRHLELPSMSDQRLSQVIRYEAESHIPFPIEDVVMDYHVLEASDEGTRALLVVIKEEKLEEYMDIVRNVSLSPEIVDISAFSLFNLYQKFNTDNGGDGPPQVLVDIGHQATDIIIFQDGSLHYARSASVASESITSEISDRLEVDIDRAEELKLRHGNLPLNGGSTDETKESSPPEKTETSEQKPPEPEHSSDEEEPPPAPGDAGEEASGLETEDQADDDGDLTLGTEFDSEDAGDSPVDKPSAPQPQDESQEDSPSSMETVEAEEEPPPPPGETTAEESELEAEENDENENDLKLGTEFDSKDAGDSSVDKPSAPRSKDEPEEDTSSTMGADEPEAEPPPPPSESESPEDSSETSGTEDGGGLGMKNDSSEENESEEEPPSNKEQETISSSDDDSFLETPDTLDEDQDQPVEPPPPPADEDDLTVDDSSLDKPEDTSESEDDTSSSSSFTKDTGSGEYEGIKGSGDPDSSDSEGILSGSGESTQSEDSEEPTLQLDQGPSDDSVDDSEGKPSGEEPEEQNEKNDLDQDEKDDDFLAEPDHPDEGIDQSGDDLDDTSRDITETESETKPQDAQDSDDRLESPQEETQDTKETEGTYPAGSNTTSETSGNEEENDQDDEFKLGQLRKPNDDDEEAGDGELNDPSENDSDDNKGEDGDNSLGAASNPNPEAPTSPSEDFDQEVLQSAIKSQVDRLIGELQQTFDYFKNEMDGDSVENIILCGNGSKLNNLPAYVEGELDRSTERFNPTEKMMGISEADVQSMIIPAGLQLRKNPAESTLMINLLPERIVQQREAQSRRYKIIANSVLAGVFVLQLIVYSFYSYQLRTSYFEKSKNELDSVQPIVDRVDKLEQFQSALQQRISIIEDLEKNQARILPLMYELNQLENPLRQRTWFESFSFTEGDAHGTLKVRGVTGDFQDVSNLYQWLGNLEFTGDQISENQSKQDYTIDEEQRSMVSFNVKYEIKFSEYNQQNETGES